MSAHAAQWALCLRNKLKATSFY